MCNAFHATLCRPVPSTGVAHQNTMLVAGYGSDSGGSDKEDDDPFDVRPHPTNTPVQRVLSRWWKA